LPTGGTTWRAIDGMEPNLFKYIWRHSKAEQSGILLLVLISLPFYFMSLDLPKSIVNKGIQGQGFDGPGSTQPVFAIDLPFGEFLTGDTVTLFEGLHLEQQDLLLTLSFAFLALVLVNGGFKFVINTLKGRMGERMLRRLRYELIDRVLRMPIPHVRKVKQAEMATMIKDEVEPLGGFIGDAFVTPVFLGGQALTAMAFILLQSVWLGLIAAAIVLVQAFLIPKLRKRILQLGRQRQLTARQLAGRVGEVIDGVVEVHANDTSNYERADFTSRLGTIFHIRYEIFQRKFFVKFLNNLLAQFTPFIFYSLGGVLAIQGQLDIGALVAVIAAYKDLPSPIKELIDWDQQRNDVQIKYEQVIEQFQPTGMIEPWVQDPSTPEPEPLSGDWQVSAVSLTDDTQTKLVESASFAAHLSDHIAIVGNSSSGKEHLGMLLAGLVRPSSGDIKIGGRNLAEQPAAVTGRRMAYVGPDAYLFPHSVYENLVYGLMHRPVSAPELDDEAASKKARQVAESERAGNPTLDLDANWIDFSAAGLAGADANVGALTGRLIEMLKLVELEDDVYRFGLSGTIDPRRHPEVAEGILRARQALSARLEAEGAVDLVVRFDPQRYNLNATVAENLLFGTPVNPAYETANLAGNELLIHLLEEEGLCDVLLEMALSIARTMVEIFADLPPGHPFFEQFSFIEADELPDFRVLVQRIEKGGHKSLSEADRRRMLGLPFRYIEARHRLGLIDEALAARIVEVRGAIATRIHDADPGAVEPYLPEGYNTAASLQDNVLFGRLAFGQAKAEETVGRVVGEVLEDLDLRDTVLQVGLDYQVGLGGKRLTTTQRQKLAIARAMLKQTDVLILNEATGGMDGATQSLLFRRVLEQREGRGVVWTIQSAKFAESFDRVLVMRAGRIVEQGSFAELDRADSALGELVHAG
jgi:putative ABC transport system ATP-binding protein